VGTDSDHYAVSAGILGACCVAVELATRVSQTGGMTAPDDIAILRIELERIEPLIWRRVAVRTSMNLKAVHSVIQAVMSWLDCHLWEFTANERKYSMLVPSDRDWNERIKNVAGTKLSALLTIGVRNFDYVYDLGDNWEHRIIVEKLKAAEPGALYPQFLGGERRCPPEVCGGIPGYYEFLDNIASKQNNKRKAALVGTEGRMIRMRSASSRSSLPSAALQIRGAPRGKIHVTDSGREAVACRGLVEPYPTGLFRARRDSVII
jgi:hypothetical protein